MFWLAEKPFENSKGQKKIVISIQKEYLCKQRHSLLCEKIASHLTECLVCGVRSCGRILF
jgi:hypothetical protein